VIERFAGREIPAWFNDAKLGIFIHWGAYSVPAWAVPLGELGVVDDDEFFVNAPYAEWYANTIRIPGSPAAGHHAKTYGDAPYDAFLDRWHAEHFDPADWAALFAGVGARYVVLTTKHHDGICLWDAPGTGTFNTVHGGPHRDLVGALAGAVRDAGMRFGAYYSGGLDWHVAQLPPISSKAQLTANRPTDESYARYAHAHVEDLIDRYAPDVLWNDIDWPDAGKPRLAELFAHYYATVPGGVVNDRWRVGWSDYLTSEYSAMRDQEHLGRPWENNRGIGYSFGYNRVETTEHHLTAPALVRHFVDIVVRGGNLLLNVGPKADGTIDPSQRDVLGGLGDWLAVNGEAVFDTRPWRARAAVEGCTGWTQTGGHLYAHLDTAAPAVTLPVSPEDVDDVPILLGAGPVETQWTDTGLRCALPRVGTGLPVALRLSRRQAA
jgi:alpha-L-fucosidase